MVSNITLRNLTTPPVKGSSPPLISTKANERDGSRPGGGGGIDPPPSTDPRFTGATYPPLVPGGAGNGTPDPLFSFDRFEYLGSFCLPANDPNHYDIDEVRAAYNPPNGFNGANGSLFCGYTHATGLYLWEFQIPALTSGADHFTFNNATVLQGPINALDLVTDTANAISNKIGFLKVINGKLYVNTHKYYGETNNLTNLLIINTPSDIASSTYQGWMQLKPGSFNDDKMANYCFEIPATKRSLFSNHTHMAGVFLDMATISRSSQGPSLFSFNADNVLPTDTVINSTGYSWWAASGTQFYKFSSYNKAAEQHYESQIGMPFETWVMVPKGATTNQAANTSPVTNELHTLVTADGTSNGAAYGEIGESVLVNNYGAFTASISVKSADRVTTYVLDTDYELDVTTDEGSYWGNLSGQSKGKVLIRRLSGGSIPSGSQLSIDYNYLTQRYDDLTAFPAPLRADVNDSSCESTTSAGALFVPNTDTIMILGKNACSRFGQNYKIPNVHSSPDTITGGISRNDPRDNDDFYWLININDLLSAATPQDVPVYEYGIFDNNRWWANTYHKYNYDNNVSNVPTLGGTLESATYDIANKKLYVVHEEMQTAATTSSKNFSKHIVSVYRIND